MLQVKAIGVLDCRAYITEEYGADAHEKIRAAMGERERDLVYDEALSALSWVDLAAVIQHAIVMDRVLGNGDGRARVAMLHELATKHFNGIYRSMFQSAKPKDVVRKIASIWNRYYDKGEATIEFLDDNNALGKVVDCPDVPRDHELLLIPYMECVLTLSGVRELTIEHPQCLAKGAEHCVFKYSWK